MITLLLKRKSLVVAFFLWASLLYFLSSQSKLNSGPEIHLPHLDKIAHFTYFALGSVFVTLWCRATFNTRALSLILPVTLLGIIGMLDEYHQSFVPGRNGNDLGDLIADILGAAAGAILTLFISTKLSNPKNFSQLKEIFDRMSGSSH